MTGPRPRVAVVGAGMAGLLAAHRLRQAGCSVQLFEAGDRAGGTVRTVRRDGWTIDTGAVTLAEPTGEVAELLAAAGATAALVAPAVGAARRYLVHRGEAVAVPTSTAEMLATPLLSVPGRLRMLKEPFVARGGDPEETVAVFARRRFGEEAAGRFIDPLISGTSGGDPERLLAAFAFPKLVEFERRSGSILKGRLRATREARRTGRRVPTGAWSASGGLGTLVDRLAAPFGAGLRLGSRVVAVHPAAQGVALEIDGGGREAADAVVMAVPAPALGMITWHGGGPDLSPVATMPHASLATVSLGFRRDQVAHPLDGHGLLAPSAEGRRILTVLFVSSLFPDRAPPGHVLVTAAVGGVRHPDDVARPAADLVALVRDECRSLLGVGDDPAVAEVTRWPAAMPLAVAGHAGRLAAADAVEAAHPRLAFCGSWRDGLAVGDVMLGGIAAAERVAVRQGWCQPAAREE